MKISAMSIAFRSLYREGEMQVSDFIRYCARIGLDGVEITRVDEEGVEEEVEEALKETGLVVASYNFGVGLLSSDEGERAHAWEEFKKGIRRAKALKARSVMLFPGPLGQEDPDEERMRLIEACRRCSEYASKERMQLTMENVGSPKGIQVHGRAEHMSEIFEGVNSPNFGLAFDTGNFVMAGEDPVEAIGKLAPFVVHVHLKDVVRNCGRCKEVAVGEGVVDFRAIFRELKSHGYESFLSLECSAPGDRTAKERMVELSVRNVKGMLATE